LSRAGAVLRRLQEEHGGGIPFERFMHEALYNPEFGYYTTRIRDVGRTGDFSTFATLGDALAKAVAGWIVDSRARDVVEVGPGNGELASRILRQLGWWRRLGLRYHLVDVDGPLRKAQNKRLRAHRVRRHAGLQEALQACGGRACIFSNELPDAFPCRLFENTESGWQEVWVRFAGDSAGEFLKPAILPDSEIFKHPHPPGQRVEVHESYHRWLRSWAPHWKSGALLTIDYGDLAPALYHRRPRGSLRGYAHHQRLEGPDIYQAPGRIDLTADVNFSDLENWGGSLGWQTHRHTTLEHFLPADTDPQTRQAATAFRVLEQATNYKRGTTLND
jgi:SAM-dependent MidA family methyltransferase